MKFDPVFGIFFALGIAMILGAAYSAWRTRQFQADAEETDGKVIALSPVSDADGTLYAPVVRFHASSGRQIEFTDALSSRPARHSVGQTVRVAYDPEQPDTTARVAGTLGLYFGPMVLLFIGVVFTALGSKGGGIPLWDMARNLGAEWRCESGEGGRGGTGPQVTRTGQIPPAWRRAQDAETDFRQVLGETPVQRLKALAKPAASAKPRLSAIALMG